MTLSCQQGHFSLPDDLHYLNCAYMSPLSRAVEEAGIEGVRRKRNPAALSGADFFAETERVRQRFAALVNAPAERIAIVPAASYGIATAARNIPLAAGQNVVVAHEQFPSNVYAWRTRCQRAGAELRVVSPPEGSTRRGEGWNARLLEAIDPATAVVALGHVHWADGTRFDLQAIGERARAHGAALVIDGTQSVGALPFDVARLRPDALVCASYKWLTGPYSLGVAYYGERFDGGEPLEENWIGRAGSEDFRGLVRYRDEFQPGAARYDVGERSNFALMPMLLAALEQLHGWGVERIQEYCAGLMEPALAAARELGFGVEEAQWRAAHLVGLRLPAGLDPAVLQAALQRHGVAASLRGDALRVSPHLYNHGGDMEALLAALREARRE